MIAIWTAFVLGLMGSLHCVAMCGPIVMALPLTTKEKQKVIVQSFLYHTGRISSYAIMGLIMGLLGWGIHLAGYQKMISVTAGVIMIVVALLTLLSRKRIPGLQGSDFFSDFIRNKLSHLLSIGSATSAFRIGFLNGFIPCGLVYVALAGALTGGGLEYGVLYMLAFGAGTLPLMVGISIARNYFRFNTIGIRKWIPLGLAIFGALLIYRGIHLQVPADLRFWVTSQWTLMCN